MCNESKWSMYMYMYVCMYLEGGDVIPRIFRESPVECSTCVRDGDNC